jgi:YD repeat-containing protein
MKKTGLLLKLICWFGLVGALTFCAGMTAIASPEGVMLKRSAYEDSVTQFNRFKITVPAGAADREITVTEVEPDLKGIRQPFNFKPVSKMFRFGPHGMKFSKGKELRFNLKLEAGQEGARLYYINREKGRLDLVEGQSHRSKTNRLEARLRHFSDYIAGIESGWDGNGINPFSDYVTNGEETVSIASRKLQIRSNVITWKGPGGVEFNLTRAYGKCGVDELKISDDWYWDIPYFNPTYKHEGGGTYQVYINIPGKGAFSNNTPESTERTGIDKYLYTYNYCGTMYRLIEYYKSSDDGYMYKPWVQFKDGTVISLDNRGMIVSYTNGYWVKYYFTEFSYSKFGETVWERRLSYLEDTCGRRIHFRYNVFGDGVGFIKAEQQLTNGTYKTIMSGNYYTFSDALGRVTTYDIGSQVIKGITYPNGARSEYKYAYGTESGTENELFVICQKRYKPGQSTPFLTVNFPIDYKSPRIRTVNDGTSIKRYYFSYYGQKIYEQIYSADGSRLLKQTDNTYYELKQPGSLLLKTSTTRIAKADGTLGLASNYYYEYDNWSNITKIVDPKDTETVMAYANTNSNKNLSTINSWYQNALYISGAAWNQMLTKATLVKDPIHGTTQLKQTHYKYDTAGNLLQEDEVYGSGYLTTKYTYDSYGNMLSKTDANNNQLCFEYADTTEKPYKSAFLTRVYKPDGTTIADYKYDFDNGNKIMATDPKGNVFRYEYDAVNRLTKEWQDNSDPKIGIIRLLSYDDANSSVFIQFGGDASDWQYGKILYDPLFGKPIKLQRGIIKDQPTKKSNSLTTKSIYVVLQMITQKEYEYYTNGLLAWEKDGLGHQTTYQYDALDRKTQITQPNGSTTQFAYDDRIVITTDANGNQKEQTYDLLDRLVSVKESPDLGGTYYTTTYTYDSFYDNSGGKPIYHLVKIDNPKGAETVNTYDNLGRLTRTDYPHNLIAAETFTYDNVGNIKTKTNSKGAKTLDYEFFAGYRLKQVTEPGGKIVSYTYDANDNPLTQTTNGVTYSYKYDARNRVTNLDAKLDTELFKLVYDYDSFSRVTGIAYPGRTTPVNYSYDELDRLQTIPGFVNSCDYDEDNKLT